MAPLSSNCCIDIACTRAIQGELASRKLSSQTAGMVERQDQAQKEADGIETDYFSFGI